MRPLMGLDLIANNFNVENMGFNGFLIFMVCFDTIRFW